MDNAIVIKGARLHNLKNITLSIPRNQVVVLTGLSGSGKSTLALETLYKESQRQFMEALGLVTFAASKPDVDSITGLPPSVSVDQHLTNRSPRSTVGTASEIFTYLRVLFARAGRRACPHCGAEIPPGYDAGAEADDELELDATYPCPQCGQPVPCLSMAHFSFNKPQGACPTCSGLGVVHTAIVERLIDPARSVQEGGVLRWVSHETRYHSQTLQAAARHYGFPFDPGTPIGQLAGAARDILLYGVNDERFRRHFPGVEPPEMVSRGRFEGLIPNLVRRYAESVDNSAHRARLGELLTEEECPDCGGTRLRPASRAVTMAGRTIVDVSAMPLTDLLDWITALEGWIAGDAWRIAAPIVADLRGRIRRFVDVGVGYLTLARATPSLSGGEAQRLRLAALLGSSLTGMLYVLDEPTIGMHPRDTERLIRVVRQLRDLGNTVLVIEHDLDVMRAADVLIDMGPGAGPQGGQIVAAGTPDAVARNSASITGHYLTGVKTLPVQDIRRSGTGQSITIHGARAHNLKKLTVEIPLGMLVAVIGVSGSGKSSLILDTLGAAANRHYHGARDQPGAHDRITGWEHLEDVVIIDQAPIGRSPRSNAATYTEVFTLIRQLFARLPEAHGLDPRHFSFNVPGGRCERCEGAGVLAVSLHFLPDVEIRCPVCRGRRFQEEVLAVRYRGLDIAEVLSLTIEEALALFADVPAIARRLALLVDVGLGYLQLGQPATMLSSGEAQRIKLAKELARGAHGHTLYLLDEPTMGLHPDDTARLLAVLQRLVDAGNTVLVIEHNIPLIRAADWLIELGPEGGSAGGYLIAAGTVAEVAANPASQTAPFFAASG